MKKEVLSIVDCATLPGNPWLSAHDCPYDEPLAVFRFRLVNDTRLEKRLRSVLQPDELARAGRYRRAEDQRRFTQARGLLRMIAGTYLHQHPAAVRFTVGPNKKPELSDAAGWHLNVSHSDDWVLLAFGRVPVGVDVEHVKPLVSAVDLLPVSFSPDEQTYVNAQADWQRAFYNLWTRKEALVKATAKGIDDDFCYIPCLDGHHQPPSQLLGRGGNWSVRSVTLADAYPAAVAYQLSEHPNSALSARFYTIENELLDINNWLI